ncbi:MAG TPA: hypothetical protein VMB50_10745, partial [Myxococcales bacterium]|nr:hypothetical protein [Myxococcales bacterium]
MKAAGAALAVLAAAVPAARALALEPIEDHRDQWGLTLDLGTVYDVAVNQHASGSGGANFAYNPGFLPALEVGGTWAVTDTGDEITARVRFVSPVLGGATDPSVLVLQSSGDSL